MACCDHDRFLPTPVPGAFRKRWILPRPKNSPPDCFYPGCAGAGLSNPITPIKKLEPAKADSSFLVGVAGFEPAASWTRNLRGMWHPVVFCVIMWHLDTCSPRKPNKTQCTPVNRKSVCRKYGRQVVDGGRYRTVIAYASPCALTGVGVVAFLE